MKRKLLLMFMFVLAFSFVSAKDVAGTIESEYQDNSGNVMTPGITAFNVSDPDGILTKAVLVYGGDHGTDMWHIIYYITQGATDEQIGKLLLSFEPADPEPNHLGDIMGAGTDLWIVGEMQIYVWKEFVASNSVAGIVKSEYLDSKGNPVVPEITAFNVSDPDAVVTEAELVYGGDHGTDMWHIIYYIKQGATDEQIGKLLLSFEPADPEPIHLGDIMGAGTDLWIVGEMQIYLWKESVATDPIAEISTTLDYTFDKNADWVHDYKKDYDTPLDWASSNAGAAGAAIVNPDIPFPVTKETEGDNTFVKLSTVKSGKESPSNLLPNVMSGSMFFGAFELNMFAPLKSTKFGLPLTNGYVTSVEGEFKYKSGETFYNNYTPAEPNKKDQWSVVAVIYEVADNSETLDGTNISTITDKTIAMGALIGGETGDWTDFSCPLYLIDANRTMESGKLYKVAVVFSSSVDGAAYNGAIGSELCLDNLKIVHSETAPEVNPNSINMTNAASTLSAYPSPATTTIQVIGAETGSRYAICNVAGSVVESGILTDGSIDVSTLSDGVYFIKTAGGIVKFIKN